MAHDVFISLSSADQATGDAVRAALEARGIRCWMAPLDIAPGAEWAGSIIDAINSARCVVLVFSSRANASVYVHSEVERALHRRIPIIRLRIEDVPPSKELELYLSRVHWLDAFTPPLDRHLGRLAAAVRSILDKSGAEGTKRQAEAAPADSVTGKDTRRSGGGRQAARIPVKAIGYAAGAILLVMLGAVGSGQLPKLVAWLDSPDSAADKKATASREPGQIFRDCPDCAEMVVIPSGSFTMGSPASEKERFDDEGPQHPVTVMAFALGKYDVTFAQWDACVADGGCNAYRPSDQGWGRGNRPVINVSWDDARSYVAWLNRKAGIATGSGSGPYRLPSEAEWEYAARAGTVTSRYWGDVIGRGNADCDGCGSQWDDKQTAPVGSFPSNAWGLYDMLGNVWQWTADCWNENYTGAPSDGSAWTTGNCGWRVVRGGSWSLNPRYLRSAVRDGNDTGNRLNFAGFRLARTLP
jgi:formylglycine-generating enzyme required for sulfatase activity